MTGDERTTVRAATEAVAARRAQHAATGRDASGPLTAAQRAEAQAEAQALREGLVGPPLPPALAHVWDWWLELHAGRGLLPLGLAGAIPAPLTHAGIGAWAQLAGVTPTPWEVRLLLACDAAYLASRVPDAPPTDRAQPRGGAGA